MLETAGLPALVAGVVLPLLGSASLTFVSMWLSRQARSEEAQMTPSNHGTAHMVTCSVTTVIAAALASVLGSALLA